MANCKICGQPIVETDMSVCRKCRSNKTMPISFIRKPIDFSSKILKFFISSKEKQKDNDIIDDELKAFKQFMCK